MHILLVNDDATALPMLEAALLNLGIVAGVTQICLDDVPRHAARDDAGFDVAFVDVTSSRDRGYETLAVLRVTSPTARLVVVHAFNGNVDIARARRMGASSFVYAGPETGALIGLIDSESSAKAHTP